MKKFFRIAICFVITSMLVISSAVSYTASADAQLANDYDEITHLKVVGDSSNNGNCYSYALGAVDSKGKERAINPGDSIVSTYIYNKMLYHYINVRDVAKYVTQDLDHLNIKYTVLTGEDNNPNHQTEKDEFLIALRVTSRTAYCDGATFVKHCGYDYHFMRRFVDKNGKYYWRYRAGYKGKEIEIDLGNNSENIEYNPGNVKWSSPTGEVYTSEIVYIVIKRNPNSPIKIKDSDFNKTIDTKSIYFNSINGYKKKIKIGQNAYYALKPKFTPINASFQNMSWDRSNQCIAEPTGSCIRAKKSGTCKSTGHILYNYGKYDPSITITIEVGDYYAGDVNGDEKLNMKDVTLLQKYLGNYNTTINKDAADVNNDGYITISDVLLMQQYIANIIKCFPVE